MTTLKKTNKKNQKEISKSNRGGLRKGAGRCSKINKDMMAKMEQGASLGLNNTELALHCDISRSTLYDRMEKIEGLSDRLDTLRSKPSIKAKLNVAQRINRGDMDASKRRLERKNKEEFSPKLELDNTHHHHFEGIDFIPLGGDHSSGENK